MDHRFDGATSNGSERACRLDQLLEIGRKRWILKHLFASAARLADVSGRGRNLMANVRQAMTARRAVAR